MILSIFIIVILLVSLSYFYEFYPTKYNRYIMKMYVLLILILFVILFKQQNI